MILRNTQLFFVAVIATISLAAEHLRAQAPEITITARSKQDLRTVLSAFGSQGEMLGLSGAQAFLDTYEFFVDEKQPITAALVISSQIPKFTAEFTVTDQPSFFKALSEHGFTLSEDGQLTSPNDHLRFHLVRNGEQLRISDDANFLKVARLPTASTQDAVKVEIDWRNMNRETRVRVADRSLQVLLPAASDFALTLESLGHIVNDLSRQRMVALLSSAETLTLKFNQDTNQQLRLSATIVNRNLPNRWADPVISYTQSSDDIINCNWNLPIDGDLRSVVQTWASQFSLGMNAAFADSSIEDNAGMKAIQEGAKTVARHTSETVALDRLQGAIVVRENHDEAIVGLGVRLSNPVRFDSELRKWLKIAMDTGAPITDLQLDVPGTADLSLHRFQLVTGVNAETNTPETMTISIATTTHALLLGFGKHSDSLLGEMVSPAHEKSTSLLQLRSAPAKTSKTLNDRMSVEPKNIVINAAPQGFQVDVLLPTETASVRTQLTGTRAEPVDATAE